MDAIKTDICLSGYYAKIQNREVCRMPRTGPVYSVLACVVSDLWSLETLGLQPNALRQFLGSCSPDLGLRAWTVGWSTPGALIQYSPNQGMTARKLLHKRSRGKSNSPNPKPQALNPKPLRVEVLTSCDCPLRLPRPRPCERVHDELLL